MKSAYLRMGFFVRAVECFSIVWFVARDVASALGYEKPSNAITQHCNKAKSLKEMGYPVLGVTELINIFGTTSITVIPESDVYRLTMRSKLDSAEAFQDWVVEEVLQSITGAVLSHRMSGLQSSDRVVVMDYGLWIIKYFTKNVKNTARLVGITRNKYILLY
jgi:prophage antirepressor-like protein